VRTMGRQGMVASPQYLATGAGLNILRRGGSAVDAALATNAVLAVVTPYMCGIGGDLFAQVYSAGDGKLIGLNGSGRAPNEATLERVRELSGGGDRVPQRGPLSVTVPGCVEAWGQLHRRFGRLPWAEVLTEAIAYAENGFPITAAFARAMRLSAAFFHPSTPARETFWPGGEPPDEGQLLRQPRMARTLRQIAEDGPDVYYHGDVAKEIIRSFRAVGGLLSEKDLAEHHSNWVEPLCTRYRDTTVYELPPNSQGVTALLMLAMLQELPAYPVRDGGSEYVHLLAEVARLAYADREGYLTDPEHMAIEPSVLLTKKYAGQRAAMVGRNASRETQRGTPGDTIYLCTADGDGNLVSLIESNFMGFGSGVMAGETGIMLQNRGHWFSLDPAHPNVIAPGKRTMHTLMPGMAFRGDRPWLVFGTMGGSTQAQIHVEILTRLIDQDMKLDEAIGAPRFDAVVGANETGAPRLILEDRFPTSVLDDLRERGHAVEVVEPFSSSLGHAHAIEILEDGVYVGAADPRADSLALGY
jgi:gamma-glutamyltranspeptidase